MEYTEPVIKFILLYDKPIMGIFHQSGIVECASEKEAVIKVLGGCDSIDSYGRYKSLSMTGKVEVVS